MSPGPTHEHEKGRLDGVVRDPLRGGRHPDRGLRVDDLEMPRGERGVEPDECFYFARDKIAAARALKKQRCNDA